MNMRFCVHLFIRKRMRQDIVKSISHRQLKRQLEANIYGMVNIEGMKFESIPKRRGLIVILIKP